MPTDDELREANAARASTFLERMNAHAEARRPRLSTDPTDGLNRDGLQMYNTLRQFGMTEARAREQALRHEQLLAEAAATPAGQVATVTRAARETYEAVRRTALAEGASPDQATREAERLAGISAAAVAEADTDEDDEDVAERCATCGLEADDGRTEGPPCPDCGHNIGATTEARRFSKAQADNDARARQIFS